MINIRIISVLSYIVSIALLIFVTHGMKDILQSYNVPTTPWNVFIFIYMSLLPLLTFHLGKWSK